MEMNQILFYIRILVVYIIINTLFVQCSTKMEIVVVESWGDEMPKIVNEFYDLQDSTFIQYKYYENGSVQMSLNFRLGKLHGDCFTYSNSGVISEKFEYWEGKLNNCALAWYENGKLKSIAFFDKGRVIERANYFPNSQIIGELEYDFNGELQKGVYYHPNGNIRSCGEWNKNRKEGIWQRFSKEGFLIDEKNYTISN